MSDSRTDSRKLNIEISVNDTEGANEEHKFRNSNDQEQANSNSPNYRKRNGSKESSLYNAQTSSVSSFRQASIFQDSNLVFDRAKGKQKLANRNLDLQNDQKSEGCCSSPLLKEKDDNAGDKKKVAQNDSSSLLPQSKDSSDEFQYKPKKKKLTITKEAKQDDSDDDFDFNRQSSAPVNCRELTNIVNNESPGLSVKSNGSLRGGKVRHRGSQASQKSWGSKNSGISKRIQKLINDKSQSPYDIHDLQDHGQEHSGGIAPTGEMNRQHIKQNKLWNQDVKMLVPQDNNDYVHSNSLGSSSTVP